LCRFVIRAETPSRQTCPLAGRSTRGARGARGGDALQAANASGPESEFSISISGTYGDAYFLPGHAQVNVTQTWNASSPGDYEAIQVNVSSGGTIYYFNFATGYGSGKRFAVGYYPWAQQYPGILGQGRPGISVLGGSNPCGTNSGSFEVRDIGRVGLEITRLWIVFTRWCEDGGVDIGEVRLGYPQTTYNVSPEVVDWPWSTVYPGQAAPEDHPVNVRLTSSKAVTAYRPKVTGPDAADFPIRKQNCTGKLTTGGCAVWVGFTPKAPGPRHATLVVPTSAGSAYVSLDGLGGVGTSDWNVSTNWPGTPSQLVMPSVSAGNPYSVISQADGASLVWTAANCKASVPYSVTAKMRFHEAADRTPPGPVTGLKAARRGNQISLTWAKPAVADLGGIIICWYATSSAPGIWSAGSTAYVGKGTSARFNAPPAKRVSISVWTYDTTGNISTPSIVHLS
jgi:hypothetical protein